MNKIKGRKIWNEKLNVAEALSAIERKRRKEGLCV
jgi:hypothetical protein